MNPGFFEIKSTLGNIPRADCGPDVMVVVGRDHRESVMDRNCAPKIDGAARVAISYSYEYTSATSLLVVKEFGVAWTTGPDDSSC